MRVRGICITVFSCFEVVVFTDKSFRAFGALVLVDVPVVFAAKHNLCAVARSSTWTVSAFVAVLDFVFVEAARHDGFAVAESAVGASRALAKFVFVDHEVSALATRYLLAVTYAFDRAKATILAVHDFVLIFAARDHVQAVAGSALWAQKALESVEAAEVFWATRDDRLAVALRPGGTSQAFDNIAECTELVHFVRSPAKHFFAIAA